MPWARAMLHILQRLETQVQGVGRFCTDLIIACWRGRLLTRVLTPCEGAILTANYLSGPSPNILTLGTGNLSCGLVGNPPSTDQRRPCVYPLQTWSSRDAGPRSPWTWLRANERGTAFATCERQLRVKEGGLWLAGGTSGRFRWKGSLTRHQGIIIGLVVPWGMTLPLRLSPVLGNKGW